MREKGWREMRGKNIKELKLEQKIKKTNNFLFPRNNNVWLCCKNGAELNSQHHSHFLSRENQDEAVRF